MAFCMRCGAVAESSIPPNDSRQRIVCTQCDFIHYENPKVICGLLATWQDARLPAVLCASAYYFYRRGILGTIVVGMLVYLPLHVGLGW